jgi:predicted oxidoreductase
MALARDGSSIHGLYAVGEAAGFGGGSAHGYNALEGTFLGGCIFTGRTAGRSSAERL